MLPFSITNKSSGRVTMFRGTFHEAVQRSMRECVTPNERATIRALPADILVAEVSADGIEWLGRKILSELHR
ncbi:MAG: hypothetical protein WC551_09440 [Patescibacteria group bacterium]|jgi:hypothetical protein